MFDYINYAEDIPSICDYLISSDNAPFNIEFLSKNAIIFCKTDYIPFLFNNLKYSTKKYVLVTHYSDHAVNEHWFINKPDSIKKWYSYAVQYDHPDVNHIPCGICPHWGLPPPWEKNKVFHEWFINNAEKIALKEKDNKTVYCNYTIDRYRPPRGHVVDELKANNISVYSPAERLLFPDYCENMSQYKFVISPPGNGIDAHRNWEAIYLGCIPIVIKHRMYRDYNLPFLQVDSYKNVTNELLENYLEYYKQHTFDYTPITLEYWRKRLKNELNNL